MPDALSHIAIGLIAGLLASPHCAGMCGAFPLHLSRGGEGGRPVLRLALYAAGKALTYVFLGALAGTFGDAVVRSHTVSVSQELLAYGAGALLVVFGVGLLDLIRLPSFPRKPGTATHFPPGDPASKWEPLRRREMGSCPGFLQQTCRSLLRSPGPLAGYLLGVGTGFLPCPITLAMLAAAAASHSALAGAVILAGLGLGTVPVLLAVGLSGAALDARVRRIGLRGAGAILIVLGLVTILRPTGLLCHILPTLGGI